MICLLCYITAYLGVWGALRWLSYSGLFIYNVVGIVACNIICLKLCNIPFINITVPCGNILFGSLFAVNLIIEKLFDFSVSKKCIYSGFVFYLLFAIIMQLCILTPHAIISNSCINLQNEISIIFSFSFPFFFASCIAYLTSQFLNIFVFDKLGKLIKSIAISSFISMCAATICDNLVFSIFAWHVLSPTPVAWNDLFSTYFINTSFLRIFIALSFIPLVKLCVRYCRSS